MAHKLSRSDQIKLLAMQMQGLKPFSAGEVDILRRELWPIKSGPPTGPDGNSNISVGGVPSPARED